MADIILSNICKKFGGKTLFKNFSLKVGRGEFLAIMGESGAGKTTLLNMMSLLERPDSGNIVLCGQKNPDFSSPTAVSLRRRHISYLFQNYGLIDTETVESNMRTATHFKAISSKKERLLIAGALGKVGLQGYEKRKAYTLSGGEQQRVAIARALINRPKILLADEPTGNLDANNAWEIMKLLEEINERGTTVVVVTHNLEIVKVMQKRIITIQKGVIISDVNGGEHED